MVQFNQILPGQSRYVFLRCRVEDETPELARVQVKYVDEVGDGDGRTLTDAVGVRFTRDNGTALKSIRASIVAEKELLLTAMAKDEALAEADAGRYQVAAHKLATQADLLDKQYQTAPESMRPQLRQEAENLRSRSGELQQNQYGSATRKSLQWESYNTRNAKQ
jgi:hypothetical protein